MKRIYLSIFVAMLTTVAFAQTTFKMVADSHAKDGDTGPGNIVANSSMMVYYGNGVHTWTTNFTYSDQEIWVSDGTAPNTRMIEFNPTSTANTSTTYGDYTSYNSASFVNPIVFNDKIYFSANNGTSTNIYTIDGLLGDTVRVIDGTWAKPLFIANGNLIYKSNDAFYKWNGVDAPAIIPNQLDTDGTTVLVAPNTYATYLNGKYIYAGKVGTSTQLYSLDPTGTGGPQLLKTLNTTTTNYIKNFVNYGNIVYFQAKDDAGIITLWQTDGTTDGTIKVPEVSTALSTATSSSSGAFGTNGLMIFHDKLYFEADDVTNYDQLYVFDLVSKAVTRLTTLVKADGSGTAVNFDPSDYVVCNDTLYFFGKHTYMKEGATTSSTVTALFKINASGAAEMIGDSYLYSNLGELTVFNNKLYMQAEDPNAFLNEDNTTYTDSGKELFVYEPVSGGNTAVNNVNAAKFSISPNPSNGRVKISGLTNSNADYQIFNIAGKRVDAGNVLNNTINYNLSAGVYMIQIKNNGITEYSKMIVK